MKKERKINAVIFDLGNTLIKTKKKYKLYFNRKYNLNFSGKEYVRIFSDVFNKKCWKDIEKAFCEFAWRCGKKNNRAFIDDLRKMWNNEHKNNLLFEATKPVLNQLNKEGYKVALLSNHTQRCREILDYHGITPYFHVIGVSAEQNICKPNVRFFRYVLKHLKVRPEEALMVGDNYKKDYLPAKKLGMHALLVERGKKRYRHSIRNLKQVKTYLKRHKH